MTDCALQPTARLWDVDAMKTRRMPRWTTNDANRHMALVCITKPNNDESKLTEKQRNELDRLTRKLYGRIHAFKTRAVKRRIRRERKWYAKRLRNE